MIRSVEEDRVDGSQLNIRIEDPPRVEVECQADDVSHVLAVDDVRERRIQVYVRRDVDAADFQHPGVNQKRIVI